MRSPALAVVLVLPVILALQGTSRGESDSAQRATELFTRGRDLIAKGFAAEACGLFNEAIQLDPDAAGIMLNLGLCNEMLGHVRTALQWFRKAQARAAETDKPEYEQAAKSHMIPLAEKIGTLKLVFASPPSASTRVELDGETVARGEWGRVEVDPGSHEIVVTASGYQALRRTVTVPTKGEEALQVELSRAAPRGRRIGTALLIGGGTLIVVASAYGLYERFGPYADASSLTVLEDRRAEQQRIKDNVRLWGTTGFVGGAVLAATGLYLRWRSTPHDSQPVAWSPIFGSGLLGIAWNGGF